jgi:IS30 family transposase
VRSHKKRKRRGYSRKHKKSHIPNRISTVVSKKSTVALQVLGDRASRLIKIRKTKNTTSEATRKIIVETLGAYPLEFAQTITYDNGHENVEHDLVNEKLGTDSYFCNPYHSWEKGTIENLIGLIRRHLPKRTNFAKISDDRIADIEHALNSRPKKCLGFRTPFEMFDQLTTVALAG